MKNDVFANFNPRTPCGVRLAGTIDHIFIMYISIHAPLAGCDADEIAEADGCTISIHAPLAGCDILRLGLRFHTKISIHAPLAGCDLSCCCFQVVAKHFNPRTPCGVRLMERRRLGFRISISIHAPLAGCDAGGCKGRSARGHFNPRTPCGVRPWLNSWPTYTAQFQSTHPLRGATWQVSVKCQINHISIHAPLAGCDRCTVRGARVRCDFNPRTPCGVRPCKTAKKIPLRDFNPRTPCGVRPIFP